MPGSAQAAAGGGGKRGEKTDGHPDLPQLDFFRKTTAQTELLVPAAAGASTVQRPWAQGLPQER